MLQGVMQWVQMCKLHRRFYFCLNETFTLNTDNFVPANFSIALLTVYATGSLSLFNLNDSYIEKEKGVDVAVSK